MSADRVFICVYGIKIEPPDEEFLKAYWSAVDIYGEKEVPEITYDSMSGEYMVLGPVLSEFDDDTDTGFGEFEECSVNDMILKEAKWRVLFTKLFPNFTYLFDNKPFKVINFIYYK